MTIITLCLCITFQIMEVPHLPTWISATTWGLFFFLFAYWIKDKETNKWLIIFASTIYLASVFAPIGYVYGGCAPLWSRILYYPSCAFACIFFNNICRWIVNLTELVQKNNAIWLFPVLTYIGKMQWTFMFHTIFCLNLHLICWQNIVACGTLDGKALF